MILATLIAIILSVVSAVTLAAIHFLAPAYFHGESFHKITEIFLEFSAISSIVALVIVIFIGVPIFFLFRHFNLASNRNISLVGFFIPSILISYLAWPLSLGKGSSTGQNYYGTYRNMIVDGVPTTWGWIRFMEDVISYGVYGLFAALVFRIVWFYTYERWLKRRIKT